MTYLRLKDFLHIRMRMSHIYQPVMIKVLLEGGGNASDKEIAKEIAKYDQSQIEYYQKITNKMVGRVLRKHNIVVKVKDVYSIVDFSQLSSEEIKSLIGVCEQKLEYYIYRRGERIWEHRNKARGYISGSIKYEVLKRAQSRCELCGISNKDRALEVDHIVPKNLGGEDSIHNYQALCYICNASKRDTDSTDFRDIAKKYDIREQSCPFCVITKDQIIHENNLAFLIYDRYPVTEYHSLVIPKRHFSDYFETTQPEHNALASLLNFWKEMLLRMDRSILGFNIGVNSGEVAGQTIPHCHMHLIPRRKQDVNDPRGGVRHIIPQKGFYKL